MKPLVLTTVTPGVGSCGSASSAAPPPSGAGPVRAEPGSLEDSSLRAPREWGDRAGDWEARLPPPRGEAIQPAGQALWAGLRRLLQLSGWPCCWPRSHMGTKAPASRLMGAGNSQCCLELCRSAHACPQDMQPPGSSHHHHLPRGRPKAQGQLKTFPAVPLRAQLSSEEISAPHHRLAPPTLTRASLVVLSAQPRYYPMRHAGPTNLSRPMSQDTPPG